MSPQAAGGAEVELPARQRSCANWKRLGSHTHAPLSTGSGRLQPLLQFGAEQLCGAGGEGAGRRENPGAFSGSGARKPTGAAGEPGG